MIRVTEFTKRDSESPMFDKADKSIVFYAFLPFIQKITGFTVPKVFILKRISFFQTGLSVPGTLF